MEVGASPSLPSSSIRTTLSRGLAEDRSAAVPPFFCPGRRVRRRRMQHAKVNLVTSDFARDHKSGRKRPPWPSQTVKMVFPRPALLHPQDVNADLSYLPRKSRTTGRGCPRLSEDICRGDHQGSCRLAGCVNWRRVPNHRIGKTVDRLPEQQCFELYRSTGLFRAPRWVIETLRGNSAHDGLSATSLPATLVWALTWWMRPRCSCRACCGKSLARRTRPVACWALVRPSMAPVAHSLSEKTSMRSRVVKEQPQRSAVSSPIAAVGRGHPNVVFTITGERHITEGFSDAT